MKYVIVLGAGRSGKAVCLRLSSLGLMPVLFDDEYLSRDEQVKWVSEAEYLIVSPSIKEDNKIVLLAKKLGKKVIGEIEFAYQNTLGNYKNLIGITGTNGKTTVVSMLGHILQGKSLVAGNIGLPWSNFIEHKYNNCILELSSFQLMTIEKFKPNIACILNLAPDHIDFHGSFEKYCQSKLHILKNLTNSDFCVINKEDSVLVNDVDTQAKKVYFGFENDSEGCFIKDGAIYLRERNNIKFILDLSILKSTLRHNILNVMAVACMLSICEDNLYKDLYNILTFNYSPYRMTDCGSIRGVKVYNDSKSTNVASTIAGLNSLSDCKNIALIIGGRYKEESFKEIFKYKNIKTIYLFGESAEIIKNEALKYKLNNVKEFINLNLIVEDIFKTHKFDCILFSPACASFDMYNSYIERGQHFDKLIKEYS